MPTPDWNYLETWGAPSYTFTSQYKPPKVLRHRFQDGKEQRVQIGSEWDREFTEKFSVGRVAMNEMLAFFKLKGHQTTFTRTGYDPYNATDAVVVTVAFSGTPKVDQVAKGKYHVTFKFREVIE